MNGMKALLSLCIAVAPLASREAAAATGKEALDACVSKLAKELSESQGAPVSVRISDATESTLRRLKGRTYYYLDAYDSANEQVVAKVDCEVDRRANVRDFKVLPEDAPLAEVRSL